MELTNKEKLIIEQAFYKAIAEDVATKNPDNLRGIVDAEYKTLYEETGAKSFDAKLNGEKVGTYSLTISKPTDSREEKICEVDDLDVLREWDGYPQLAMHYIFDRTREAVAKYFKDTGEVPPGCITLDVVYPGNPGGEVERTALKVDTDKVAEALGNRLPEAAMLLLGGGNSD